MRVLPPSVFWPRPKVESAVVTIRPDAARRAALDVAWFHELVRRLFLHRRKNLRHVLFDLWPDQWTKTEAEVWLEALWHRMAWLRAEGAWSGPVPTTPSGSRQPR